MTQENWTDHVQVSMDFLFPFSQVLFAMEIIFRMFKIYNWILESSNYNFALPHNFVLI